jgi:Transposase IS66 family
VKRIDELFGIDALARGERLDHAARHALRLETAPPLVEIIRGEVEAARDASLPSSALGKAASYTLAQWQKLTRFLEHAELELSNNLAENSMRPVALGRNYVRAMIMCSPKIVVRCLRIGTSSETAHSPYRPCRKRRSPFGGLYRTRSVVSGFTCFSASSFIFRSASI